MALPGGIMWPVPNWPPPAPAQPPVTLPPPGPPTSLSPTTGALGYTNSAYGGMIPIVYGSDRVTGNVIWASMPVQVETEINGQAYVYQVVSFAVALCEGAINGVLKIWAGPKLALDNSLQVDGSSVVVPPTSGAIGTYTADFTDPTGAFSALDPSSRGRITKVTVFNGDEFQQADGIMSGTEGYENTPAYRGCAYVLFEDFPIEQNNVPALFFEVISHTSTDSPRMYSDFVDTTFDTWKYSTLQYDPAFDRFYTLGQKTSPAARGIEVTDGNALEELAQFEIENYNGIGVDWGTLVITPLNGILVATAQSGNKGIVYTFNPLSGGLLDTLGPGGNLVGNGVPGNGIDLGFGAIVNNSCVLAFSCPVGFGAAALQDVFCAVGFVNQSVGLASIDSNGGITMLSTNNSVLPNLNNTICYLNIDLNTFSAVAALRHFYDGYVSVGQHVYGFSYANNEATSIKVWRLTAASPTVNPTAPVYIHLADLPVDIWGGTGFAHNVRLAIVDGSDRCILLFIEGASSTWMCKYSPYTGHILWNTAITALPVSIESQTGPDFGLIHGKYAWIDGAGAVWRADLSNGNVTSVMTNLSTQSLPALSNAKQYYNGGENSITYLTATATKHMTKFFIDRLARETIALSQIVVDLVERTGLLPSDIDVDDLSELELYGYSITQVQSIRSCFSELSQAFTYDVVESNGRIHFKTRGNGVDGTIPHTQISATNQQGEGGNENAWLNTQQINDGARIRKINLTYKDIDRDFAQNVQSIILNRYGVQVFDPEAAINVQVPLVMTAQQAVQLGEVLLYSKLTYNTTYDFTLSPANLIYDAADVVTITMPDGEDDITVRLRVVTVVSDNSVQVQASEENSDIYDDQVDVFGNLGRFTIRTIPQPPGRIIALFMTVPGRRNDEIGSTTVKHRLFLTLLNTKVTPALTQYLNATIDGVAYTVSPPESFPTWGLVVTPPSHTKSTASWDDISTVVVDIINYSDAVAIASAINGKADLLDSDTINLCYIAGELFQFTDVASLGGDRYQFTGLARGKMGTDPYCQNARAGDHFIMIAGVDGTVDPASGLPIDVPVGTTPIKQIQVNLNTGSPFQPTFGASIMALNLTPFRVADFRFSYVSTDVVMSWQRRSRTADGAYPDDGSVAPSESVTLPELSETYVLYLYKTAATFDATNPATYLRKVTVTTNAYTYTAAFQTADAFVRATDTLYVQIQETGSNTGFDDGDAETHSLPHV